MNDVALRANDVLRNDVGLRPMMLRFAQTDFPRPFLPRVLKNTENCAIINPERRYYNEKSIFSSLNRLSGFIIAYLGAGRKRSGKIRLREAQHH